MAGAEWQERRFVEGFASEAIPRRRRTRAVGQRCYCCVSQICTGTARQQGLEPIVRIKISGNIRSSGRTVGKRLEPTTALAELLSEQQRRCVVRFPISNRLSDLGDRQLVQMIGPAYRHRWARSQSGSSRFGSRCASGIASSRRSIKYRQSGGTSATQNIVK